MKKIEIDFLERNLKHQVEKETFIVKLRSLINEKRKEAKKAG